MAKVTSVRYLLLSCAWLEYLGPRQDTKSLLQIILSDQLAFSDISGQISTRLQTKNGSIERFKPFLSHTLRSSTWHALSVLLSLLGFQNYTTEVFTR